MSVCISCGNEIAENVNFCMHCGAPQAATAAEEPKEICAEDTTEKSSETIEAADDVSTELTPTVEEAAEAPAEPVFIPEPTPAEEKNAPAFESAVIPPAPAYEPPKTASVTYAEPAGEKSRPEFTPTPVPAEDPEKPGPKSKWGIMSTWGYVGATLLMSIPIIGFIITIVWACGGCRKYAKRNYARATLIFLFAGIILAVVSALILRFIFPELIVWAFEYLNPGYTIIF